MSGYWGHTWWQGGFWYLPATLRWFPEEIISPKYPWGEPVRSLIGNPWGRGETTNETAIENELYWDVSKWTKGNCTQCYAFAIISKNGGQLSQWGLHLEAEQKQTYTVSWKLHNLKIPPKTEVNVEVFKKKSLLKHNFQFECSMKNFYIMSIFISGSSCWNNIVFHFCFVFRHVVKQEKGSVLPANRVLWVIVVHVPCFSPHPLNLLTDSLRLKRSHFSLSRPRTKSHR